MYGAGNGANPHASVGVLMPGSPFFGDADSMADSGTALNLLRNKFPGMFGDPGTPPTPMTASVAGPALFNNPAPNVPASTSTDPGAAPDIGQPTPNYKLPWMREFQQAQQAQPQPQRPPMTTPTGQMVPGLTKGQKLMVLLKSGVEGALAGRAAQEQTIAQTGGRRAGGVGTGFMAGLELPAQQSQQAQTLQHGALENQQLQQQVSSFPQIQALNFGKTLSDIQKNLADAGKANADAATAPMKAALDAAQSLAARYKEDPGSGQLIDLQTGQPFGNSSALAPLSAQEAAVLGKQEGDRVPIKLKNTASEIVNRGIKSVSAGGRQLLVDGNGNTIKDLGQATPLVTMNAQMNPPSQITPEMQKAVDMVGKNQMDLQTALMNYRRFPGQSQAFLGALADNYPDYFQGNYGASKGVLEYFTSGEGAKNINAFNTATEHLGQLQQLGTALDNKNMQAWNAVKNQVETWFGGAAPGNFNLVRSAVAGEISKTFKGQVTDPEIKSITDNVNSSQSQGQLNGVIGNALALMRSKMQANVEQYQKGRQAQPAFPSGTQGGGTEHPFFSQFGGTAKPQ